MWAPQAICPGVPATPQSFDGRFQTGNFFERQVPEFSRGNVEL